MGFCSYVEDEPSSVRPITRQEYVLMVSGHHPLARKHTVTLKEAACYDFILPLDKTNFRGAAVGKASITPAYLRPSGGGSRRCRPCIHQSWDCHNP